MKILTLFTLSLLSFGVLPVSAAVLQLPKTGQTVSYLAGDDGSLQEGVTVSGSRFTDNSNGTITDNLTGLIWLKNANCRDIQTWTDALKIANSLSNGICGLTDKSIAGDWRLPNVTELESLADLANFNPALPTGHPFSTVKNDAYWTSTTNTHFFNNSWVIKFDTGIVHYYDKTLSYYLWPVRGGQSVALGACGSSNEATLTSIPTTDLCTTGAANTVTGSGPWYWTCTGINGGTTASCSAFGGTPPVIVTTTKAKVYLGSDDNFTVSNSGTTLYGGAGNDTVTLASGVTGVTLDQNVDRINVPNAASGYAFKQTGNKINMYDASGSTLIAIVPVQGDSNGTQLSFNNSIASVLLSGGVMTVGGATVSSTAATVLSPQTVAATPSTVTTTTAKVYLGSDDSFTVSNSGTTLYGGAGNDTVTLASGVSGVTLDQNVDRINLPDIASSYAFKQTGNKINIYNASGSTLLVVVPVQGDSDGTILSFKNGSASALLIGGVMAVGGATVNGATASVLTPTLIPAP